MVDKTVLALEQDSDRLRGEGKFTEAIEKLHQALAIDSDYVLAHLGLAVLYHHTGDYEKSVAHGEKAVALEPEDSFNHTALSVTYQRAFEGTRDPIYIQKAEDAKARSHR